MRSRYRTARGALGFSTRRRGTVLTWFAIFLFVLLPLMTIIVHLGMVTLTRRQMQNAANSAAIEGLRGRDEEGLTETERRERVRDLVSAIYDDNLNSDGADALRLGAGPIIGFDNESTDIALPGTNFIAARTVRSENLSVYDPSLELNTADNEQHGDMVSGQYDPAGSHSEDNTYQRGDFVPDGINDAFLVRLRRTNNPSSLDALADISSSGPTIPFLFGRGPYGGTDFLNRRERGTIVRATAIAQEQPVITVGVPEPSDNLNEGLALFEIDLATWEALANNSPASVSLVAGVEVLITGELTGRLIEREVTTLGDQTTALDMIPADLEIGAARVAAITTTIGMDDHIVVGFGLVEMNGSPMSYTITRLPGEIVFRNAVASFGKPVSGPVPDFTDVWSIFQTVSERALAPALVRSIE